MRFLPFLLSTSSEEIKKSKQGVFPDNNKAGISKKQIARLAFKLSTEVFPDKDNPYDSYAEALMAPGKNKEAIKNYKKSLELNPNNQNAVEMLKKLEQ